MDLCLGVVQLTPGKNRSRYFAFVDLEKAFDRVLKKFLGCTLRKVGVQEWIVRVVQIISQNARSRVRINNSHIDLKVQLGFRQGSAPGPLLFIIVLETLSREFRNVYSWERFCADDLVIVVDTINELSYKFGLWKKHLEAKGFRRNMGKTKIMVCCKNLHSLKDSGKHLCGVENTFVLCVVCVVCRRKGW